MQMRNDNPEEYYKILARLELEEKVSAEGITFSKTESK
jgi:hypothetical protein